MTLGEKIKKLRTDKLMSQSELAGSEITRNMLSQIEHGSATPSLSTIKYIASRLNVSVGFLLADEEDERLYLKRAEMDDIKKAYASKNFRLCYDMCKNFSTSDDEITLILSECSLRVGVEELCKGNLRTAAEYLDEALLYCSESIYNTDSVEAEAASYFSYMELISPSLVSNVYDGVDGDQIILIKNEFSIYSSIIFEAETRGWVEIDHLEERINRLDGNSTYALHLIARDLMSKGEYDKAHDVLHSLLYKDDYDLPEPMLYFIFCDIEICCKEIDDFKGAYEYSASKMALSQKLLA